MLVVSVHGVGFQLVSETEEDGGASLDEDFAANVFSIAAGVSLRLAAVFAANVDLLRVCFALDVFALLEAFNRCCVHGDHPIK